MPVDRSILWWGHGLIIVNRVILMCAKWSGMWQACGHVLISLNISVLIWALWRRMWQGGVIA
jgi:hypothetical protein